MSSSSSPSDTVTAYGIALQAGDKSSILALYTDDAEIVPDQIPSLSGRAAISQFYDDTFATIAMKVELQIVDVVELDGMAIVRSEQPVDVVHVANGQETKSYFRELFVLKNVDGSWKIFKYMFSQNLAQAPTDVPPHTG
ncbi:nuclear transport factor 2 family protein [Nocardia sp. NBC_00881]|uniref:YybH family protein n=1 Tax=Nocardia sp. NBC_00881 TaxID=2975995 RepID=UPI00386D8AA1|nr:nuclear transport factor 2 family protein [Nocardia sp. NBC_00881]